MVDFKSVIMTLFSPEDILKANDLPWLPGSGRDVQAANPPYLCLRAEPQASKNSGRSHSYALLLL